MRCTRNRAIVAVSTVALLSSLALLSPAQGQVNVPGSTSDTTPSPVHDGQFVSSCSPGTNAIHRRLEDARPGGRRDSRGACPEPEDVHVSGQGGTDGGIDQLQRPLQKSAPTSSSSVDSHRSVSSYGRRTIRA